MSINFFEVTDNVILISGSSRGIGFDVAIGYLQAGALVTICGNNQAELEESFNRISVQYPNKVA